MPVEVVTGKCPPLTLVLRPTGSIAGRIVRNGQPLPSCIVGIGWPELSCPTVEGNAFFAAGVPAGPVKIFTHPMDSFIQAQSTTVEVIGGTTVVAEIDIQVGSRSLLVSATPRAGAYVTGAKLFLFDGTETIERQWQVPSNHFRRSRGTQRWRASAASPLRFPNLLAGHYTLCVLPLDADPDERHLQRHIQERGGDLRVHCMPIAVAPEPAEQTVMIELPAPEPLPAL